MPLPAWGVALIVVYCLLQIPAVLLIARYCEVDAEDLPTPPMRAYWRGDDAARSETSPRSDGPPEENDATLQQSATPQQSGDAGGDVRCEHCGAWNDPSYGRCRHCVEPL